MTNNNGASPKLNKFIQGDCLQELASFSNNSIDLTVFSPPYDGIRDYKNNWSFDFVMLGKHLYRVTKDGGVAVVVIGDGTKNFAKSLTSFRLAVNWVDEIGMIPSKHAGKIYSGTDRLTNGGFKKIEPKAVNPLKCRGTVWNYSTSNTVGLLHDSKERYSISKHHLSNLPTIWDGKESILELKEARFNWRQMEWWGFYFEHLCYERLEGSFEIPGDRYGTARTACFDLKAQSIGV
jgi:hypothetical protein